MKIYKIKPLDEKGLLRVSLVKDPAIQTQLMAFSDDKNDIKMFVNEDRQEIYAPALIPDKLIFRKNINGEPANVFFDSETIKELHLSGSKNQYDNKINLNHEEMNVDGVFCFETWLIEDPKNDKANALGFDLPKGTLMKAYKVESPELWAEVKKGNLTGLSIEAYLDHENDNTINLNKQTMNKKSIFEHIKSLFMPDGSTEYATGFFGTSLEIGSIITDTDGNPLPNATFDYEGNTYMTDDMGSISEMKPIEAEDEVELEEDVIADTSADTEKLNARILELETENASLKAELTKAEETKMAKEEEILKLQSDIIDVKKISNMPKAVEKTYEQMTNLEKAKFNRGKL